MMAAMAYPMKIILISRVLTCLRQYQQFLQRNLENIFWKNSITQHFIVNCYLQVFYIIFSFFATPKKKLSKFPVLVLIYAFCH